MRSRRGFGFELLGLGAAAIGCSASGRVRELDDGGLDAMPETTAASCPSGASGLARGDVLKQIPMQGYFGGTGAYGPISVCDYFDPDGARGINALLLVVSAQWCSPCRAYATALHDVAPKYLARGARILELLLQGADNLAPATKDTVDLWSRGFGVTWDVGCGDVKDADAGSFPVSFYVNPRTLVIEQRLSGFDLTIVKGDTIPQLDVLLAKNGA
jgi:hypothetical protein